MKQEVLIGQTDYTVLVKMRDDAGAPATGLAHTDIDIAYARVETDNDVTTTDVAPADLANLTAAHSDWGWEEVSSTDHPGLYRLDIADAVFASGAWSAVVTVSGTGLDPADLEFVLVPSAPLSGVLLAPTTHTSAVIPTVTTATNVTTVNGLAANVITAAATHSDFGTEIGTAVWASGTRTLTSLSGLTVDTVTTLTNLPAITANWLTAAGTHSDFTTEIQSGLATAAELAKVPKSDSNVTWNATALASIQSEANDALVANNLDHLVLSAVDTNFATTVHADSVIGQLADNGAGFDRTTDSLEAIRDRGDAAWTTATGFSTHSASDVWAVGTRTLTAATNLGFPSNFSSLGINASGHVSRVTLADTVTTLTGHTPQTGDAYAIVSSGTHGNAALKTLVDAVQADLPTRVTKNTALSGFMFFMVLAADHVTGATGLTVTATRSLDGAAFGACANAVSEVSAGWYKIDLAAGDLNGNVVALKFTAATADARMMTIVTQPT